MKNQNIIDNPPHLNKKYVEDFISFKNFQTKVEGIDTGNLYLNKILGCQGFPIGRITEIYGGESCGKTTIALQAAKQLTLQKEPVLYIDLECALDISYLQKIDVDMNYLFIARPRSGERVFDMIEEALLSNSYKMIIVDSVAAMTSEEETQTSVSNSSSLGQQARLMARGLRKIQIPLSNSSTALIFINQIREKIGIMFGNPETTTGGRALKYFSSIRLEAKKVDLIKNGEDKIGIKTKLTTVKNKITAPYQTAYINIYFSDGYNMTMDLIEFAIQNEIIKKSGSWFYYEETKLCQGLKNLKQYGIDHPEWLENIKNQVQEKLNLS